MTMSLDWGRRYPLSLAFLGKEWGLAFEVLSPAFGDKFLSDFIIFGKMENLLWKCQYSCYTNTLFYILIQFRVSENVLNPKNEGRQL